ncbi:hypothetical protein GGR52DRAFT_523309 [Hypoxylon sp. FL1284]|nr:hypothetical protein GGR52DRAFT_523309 [Hypoxylon sp. FL1284]
MASKRGIGESIAGDAIEGEHNGPAPPRPIKRRKIKSPEIGSLYDILHDHAGSSLYVPPFCWTDQHAALLGRFVQRPSQNTPSPSASSSPQRTPQPQTPPTKIRSIGGFLDKILATDCSHIHEGSAIQTLMAYLFPFRLDRTTSDLSMRCGGHQIVYAVRCQVMWKCARVLRSFASATASITSSSSTSLSYLDFNGPFDTPILAYISRSHLNYLRKNCFRISTCPDGSFNHVIHNLQQLRSRKLIPKNLDEDQYIIAIMIAMAQQHAYTSLVSARGYAPRDIRVAVMSVSREDASFIVYKAVVPAALLDLFHCLDKAPSGDPKITVEYQRVPIWPVLGLKERLGQALGKDIVGEVDPNCMETYEDPWVSESDNESLNKDARADPLPPKSSTSRTSSPSTPRATPAKRKALSEVFNTSFSEDRDSADFPSELAKRRCLEEGRVGVVQ